MQKFSFTPSVSAKTACIWVVFHLCFNGHILAQGQVKPETRLITLTEAIQYTMQNNLALKMAQKDSAIARANISDARMGKAPFLNAGAYYNYVGNPVLFRGFYTNDSTIEYYNHQAGWSVAMGIPIYMAGKNNTRIAQEEVISRIQNEMVKMTEAEIRLSVINQFYTLYKLYKEVEIIELNISSIKTQIKQLQSKVANGQNLLSDLSRTELQLSNFEIDVFSKKNSIEVVSNYICTFAGLPTSEILEPKDVVIEIPAETLLFENCLQEAYTNRQEIKQSELQRKYSELSLRMTKNSLKPVVTGTAIYNSEMPIPGTFPPESDILNYWAVGVGLTYEISSIYNLKHKIKTGTLQIEKENLNMENVRNMINNEVKSAFMKFQESKVNVGAYQKNVELAELNYKIVKSKYDNEFALIIDMIDAEAQVNDARISLNNAIIDAISQYYNLLYSMGKLN